MLNNKLHSHRQIQYRIGLDLGDGSIGYSVLRTDEYGKPYRTEIFNSVIFPNGENPVDGSTLNSKRRTYRAGRRLHRRRSYRKHRVRQLFIKRGLMTERQIKHDFFRKPMPSVYKLRTQGLDRVLSPQNLFLVLYYLAGHRGFKSNRRYALQGADANKLTTAINEASDNLEKHGYRSLGEMLQRDARFKHQKRNHGYNNGYLVMASRSMISNEALKILDAQRELGSLIVTRGFIDKYIRILNSQRNLDDGPGRESPYSGSISRKVGPDSLDHRYMRGAKGTYTFEVFNLLTNLNQIRYQPSVGSGQYLSARQRKQVFDFALQHKSVNYHQVRKVLKLSPKYRFNMVFYQYGKKPEKAEAETTLGEMDAIYDIRKALPADRADDADLIDAIGDILTKYKSDEKRTEYLAEKTNLNKKSIAKLVGLNFSEFARLSLHTMRKMIPYLMKGYLYSEAAQKAGYDFRKLKVDMGYIRETVSNPVVLHAFSMVIKVVNAIIQRYGKPIAINIELARDLAKNGRAKRNIHKYDHARMKANAKNAERLRNYGVPVNGQNIIVSNLYREQGGIDPYTGKQIAFADIFNGNNKYNIDHIVPYSWTFDDSYTNKVLVSAKANEDKANRLPLQYLADNPARRKFLVSFAKKQIKNPRKRSHLLCTAFSQKDRERYCRYFRARNLNDTRYLNRLVANYLRQNVSFNQDCKAGKERVVSLNGAMTSKLRSRWGLPKYYKDSLDRRHGDLNHAIDAVVIACVTPALIKRINYFSKYQEIINNPRLWDASDSGFKKLMTNPHNNILQDLFNDFPLPWHDFRREVLCRISPCPAKAMQGYPWKHYLASELRYIKPIHVVNVHSHKVNGQLNLDTNFSGKYLKYGRIMKRIPVDQLKLDKKGHIKKGVYKYLGNSPQSRVIARHLASQMASAVKTDRKGNVKKRNTRSGADAFPDGAMRYRDRSGKEHIVRRVKTVRNVDPRNFIRSSDGGSVRQIRKCVRIDVFRKHKRFCYVPYYLRDVLSNQMPSLIARASKKATYADRSYQFQFSLYPYTPVYVKFKSPRRMAPNPKTVPKGALKSRYVTEFYGYYIGMASGGSINLVSFDRSYTIYSLGISRLVKFEKLDIDYFGRLHRVNEQKRVPISIGTMPKKKHRTHKSEPSARGLATETKLE